MGGEMKFITNDATEACKKLGIKPEDLIPKQLDDFIEKGGNPDKEKNLAQARLTHF